MSIFIDETSQATFQLEKQSNWKSTVDLETVRRNAKKGKQPARTVANAAEGLSPSYKAERSVGMSVDGEEDGSFPMRGTGRKKAKKANTEKRKLSELLDVIMEERKRKATASDEKAKELRKLNDMNIMSIELKSVSDPRKRVFHKKAQDEVLKRWNVDVEEDQHENHEVNEGKSYFVTNL
ncbi:hypothetical protein G6F56_012074 [Rhizopus delemar]|nr:hypothetical protein G6F56_012074 [Rhizopus delemar]